MSRRNRVPWTALFLASTLLLGLSLFRVVVSLAHGSGLTHESGVLCGLAMDYRDGLFYRPLIGPSGYGGTRYGAFHIVLQGSLMRMGLPAICSGHIVSIVSAIAVVAALYVLLRELSVPAWGAFCFALLAFAGASGQYSLTTIRVDLLSAALSFWGLVWIAASLRRTKNVIPLLALAGFFFALAILTKITDGFGIVAAAICLLLMRRWRDAVTVTAITGFLSIAGLLILNSLSHGQMFDNFRACAVGGRNPLTLRQWCALLYEVLVRNDWNGSLLMLTSLLAWATASEQEKRSLPGILLIAAIGITLPLYFSPGLSTNHLIDAEAAAALFLGYWIARTAHAGPWIIAVTAILLCCIARFVRPMPLMECFYARTDAFRRAAASDGPIFSDHALIPVAAGHDPFLLDDYTFPAVRHVRPEAQTDLYRRLDQAFFAVVVLRYDPRTGDRPSVFGAEFASKLEQHYVLVSHTTNWDHLWIYHRRSETARP